MAIEKIKKFFTEGLNRNVDQKDTDLNVPKKVSENDDGAYYEKLEFCAPSSNEELYDPFVETKRKKTDFAAESDFAKGKNKLSNFSKNSFDLSKEHDLNSFYFKKRFEKRDIVFLVIEDSKKVEEYKNEVMKVLNKMVSNNSSRLFYFIRTGKNEKSFGLYDYSKLEQDKLFDNLFDCSKDDEEIRLSFGVSEIYDFLYSLEQDNYLLEYNKEKFEITDINIIFIGTGAFEKNISAKIIVRDQLANIKLMKNVKSIKYFCIEDRNMVLAASCGFPVIGHILTSFYQ